MVELAQIKHWIGRAIAMPFEAIGKFVVAMAWFPIAIVYWLGFVIVTILDWLDKRRNA